MSRIPRNAIIAAALLMGILAAFMAYSYMSTPSPTTEAAAKVTVIAARNDISMGAILTAEMLQTQSVAPENLPPDAVTDPQAALGMVVISDIKAGEPLKIGDISGKTRLSHMIPKFMRAVTVAIDPIIGVGGYLEPGDRGDVVATFNSNAGTLTKIVLQDAQLIAIGSEVVEEKQPSSGEGVKAAPKAQTNATLAVMPSEAERLILAESRGKLRLVLRRSDDSTYTQTKGITSRALFGVVTPDVPPKVTRPASPAGSMMRPGPSAAVPQLPTPMGYQRFEIEPREKTEAQAPPKKTIEIIRGTKAEQVTVDQ